MPNDVVTLQGRRMLTRATHKTGKKLCVEMTFALVNGDSDKQVTCAVAVAREVAERVEQERAAARRVGSK